MRSKRYVGLGLLVGMLFLVALACGFGGDGPPSNAIIVDVVANSSLGPWLEQAVADFNESEVETADGDPVYVQMTATDAGQAVIDLAGGAPASLWIPDDEVWVSVLADQGNNSFQGDCVSVAESPLVLAMWRPVAESLGWPGRDLGWLDVGSLAADPSAWAYYSGGQFGDVLRLGHTHPGLSGTGASTLLALVQAAESKAGAVSAEDIQQPIVQASVGAFESAVSWFSSNTATLGQTMGERGVSFLGVAVMYESDVVQYGGGDPGIVPVYPFEGTFVASHPACISNALDAPGQEAAGLFRDYLLDTAAQQLAVANGLRPVGAVAVGPPLDESRGVDLAQPETVFSPPTVETVYAIQELWQSARKAVNLVMLIDVSGSMRGSKIDNVREAAVQFVQQMGDEDYISILAFSSQPRALVKYQPVGPGREQVIQAIRNLEAEGDTALYDAIGDGASLIANTTNSETTNALVVLTDGLDTSSFRYNFDQALIDAAKANDTTVFTIAYGNDADAELLESLALQANGNYFSGDQASITAIYDEMSAAFGGAVGVGR